jgi:hypothetical protein
VQLSAAVTASNCAGLPTIAWTTGDGGASSQAVFTHTYLDIGDFPWTLNVLVDGETCAASGAIRVVPQQVIPHRRLRGRSAPLPQAEMEEP